MRSVLQREKMYSLPLRKKTVLSPALSESGSEEGGGANINIKNLGSTQVQPRLKPGSDPGSTQFEPTFNPGSTQVL